MYMAKKDYSNLRNKTIFDFTSDESVLKRVNPFSVFDKEDYLRHCKKAASYHLNLPQYDISPKDFFLALLCSFII